VILYFLSAQQYQHVMETQTLHMLLHVVTNIKQPFSLMEKWTTCGT